MIIFKFETGSILPRSLKLCLVSSIPRIITGSSIGKDRIGNNAFFVFALANKADIIVVDDAIPKLPIKIVNKNIPMFSGNEISIKIKNKTTAK